MTLHEFNKYNNANANANLPEWKRNQPTSWHCQNDKVDGKGRDINRPTEYHNPTSYRGVTYWGK